MEAHTLSPPSPRNRCTITIGGVENYEPLAGEGPALELAIAEAIGVDHVRLDVARHDPVTQRRLAARALHVDRQLRVRLRTR